MRTAILGLGTIFWFSFCVDPGNAEQHEIHFAAASSGIQGQSEGQQIRSPAQHEPQTMPAEHEGMVMPGTQMNSAGMALMEQASGTSVNPKSAPHEMILWRAGAWNLMFHGVASLNEIQQTGPRGGGKLFSANWFMGMAEHSLGGGSLLVRAMLSLDPATVTHRNYPLLFQTGETVFGKPLVDGQHPHEFVMELGLQYARPWGEKAMFGLYVAPVGDPALGPVAFPHRVSAAELPQAPRGHHLQDSSHIANEVITGTFRYGFARLEVSGFHGAEPNENRWNIDYGRIDSWAARLTFSPRENWNAQVSVGRLAKPEALEEGDIVRATASLTYHKPWATGHWAASFIWGRNHKVAEKQNVNSYLAESVLRFRKDHFLTGRVELVDREELFHGQHEAEKHSAALAESVFRITAFTFGYTRDFRLFPKIQSGVGANVTVYRFPLPLKPFYGNHPAGVLVFLRFRLREESSQAHQHSP